MIQHIDIIPNPAFSQHPHQANSCCQVSTTTECVNYTTESVSLNNKYIKITLRVTDLEEKKQQKKKEFQKINKTGRKRAWAC